MEEFENDDIEINKPLDVRFVVLGLGMMIFGLVAVAFIGNIWAKYFGLFCFFASFFTITKKAKKDNLQ